MNLCNSRPEKKKQMVVVVLFFRINLSEVQWKKDWFILFPLYTIMITVEFPVYPSALYSSLNQTPFSFCASPVNAHKLGFPSPNSAAFPDPVQSQRILGSSQTFPLSQNSEQSWEPSPAAHIGMHREPYYTQLPRTRVQNHRENLPEIYREKYTDMHWEKLYSQFHSYLSTTRNVPVFFSQPFH